MKFRFANRGRSGVTLVEVLVVVIILGIIMSMGLPRYRDYMTSQSLLGLQAAVASKLREATPLAKALRKNIIVAIDLDNEQAWLELDGAQYGAKAPAAIGMADIKAIADGSTPKTTGIARYSFSYWSTVSDTPALPSFTIHFGQQSDAYNSSASNTDFRSITLMGESGRARDYTVGCFGSAPWGGWPLCSTLQ